jgi:hypothetical protein
MREIYTGEEMGAGRRVSPIMQLRVCNPRFFYEAVGNRAGQRIAINRLCRREVSA